MVLAIGSYEAGATPERTASVAWGGGSTTALGRPRVTAGGELAITSRARRTAGGTLVGLQSPSSARAPRIHSTGAPKSHSPSATLRPAVVLPLIGLPFFPGCVTYRTAKVSEYSSRTLA